MTREVNPVAATLGVVAVFILGIMIGRGSVDTSTSDECIVAVNMATQVVSLQRDIISYYENQGDNLVTLRTMISDLQLKDHDWLQADTACRHK